MGCLRGIKKAMINNYIPVNRPILDGNEKRYLIECIDSGWISSEGPFVKRFEEEFAAKVGRKYGVAVCNGTAALDAAIMSLDISEGDEVIMPTFTIISCVSQIIRNKAVPIFIDSDPLTWNIDVSSIEEKISKKTKAILVPHIYGLPADMDHIIYLAKKYNLKVIEDAAEMHGQYYKNKQCGSFGDVSTFSFYSNKNMTTGEGGMIVTDDAYLAERCKSLRNLCFQPDKRFVHEELGWNLRMTNMQAALGVAQLERLDEFVLKKREAGISYSKLLGDIIGIQLPLEKTDYADNIYWIYGIVIGDEHKIDALSAMEYLHKKGIGTRPFFYPMHLQPILNRNKSIKNKSFPVAENMYKKGFYIPSGLGITKEEIEKVSKVLHDLFK
jgi:perosamine synthetase